MVTPKTRLARMTSAPLDVVGSASMDLDTAASSGYGGHSGYGSGSGYGGGGYSRPTFLYKEEEDCDNGLNPLLALGTLGLLAGATFFIINRIENPVAADGRRRFFKNLFNVDMDWLTSVYHNGKCLDERPTWSPSGCCTVSCPR